MDGQCNQWSKLHSERNLASMRRANHETVGLVEDHCCWPPRDKRDQTQKNTEFKISSARWMVKPPRVASTRQPGTEYLMEVSSTGLSRSATKETNRPTHATVHPLSYQQLPRQPAAASGAATPGPPPFRTMGSLGLLPFDPRWYESTSFRGSQVAFSLGCQPGVRVALSSPGRFLGRRPSFFLR